VSLSFKENVYGKYQEKKDHIVAKLGNLTNSQKRILIDHLDQFPHKESMIDWNNKDLKWEDFAEMLATTSKTQKKALVKKEGLGGLEEGKDYHLLYDKPPIVAVMPKNYEASKLLASKNIAGCEGEWCTAYHKTDDYWKEYISRGPLVYIINFEKNDKMAFMYEVNFNRTTFYDAEDNEKFDMAAHAFIQGIDVDDLDRDQHIQGKGIIQKIIRKAIPLWEKLPRNYGRGDDFSGEWDADKTGNTWNGAFFKNGNWLSGTFEDGLFVNGNFLGGVFADGVFGGGLFDGGIWRNGRFRGGEFRSGTWEGGRWHRGRWTGGDWKGGWIYDPDKKGNYQPDWKWTSVSADGVYHSKKQNAVYSPISPAEYFANTR
jgi:hypothetical protein